MKTQEQLTQELTAPLPKEAIKPHPTKTYLSSIKAIYVTERLSQVFGIGGWRLKTELIKEGEKGMIVVKVILEVPDYNIYYESFGGNDNGGENSKNFDLGDAYKGATTDAITKIGSYLGIGIDVFKGKVSVPQSTSPVPPQQPVQVKEPTTDEKAANMLKKPEVDLTTHTEAIDKITTAVGLNGYYTALSNEDKANTSVIELLTKRREALNIPQTKK